MPFPPNFVDVVKVIFKRLFRVYAHIYHSHFKHVCNLGEEAHLNTCFKHFMYFAQVRAANAVRASAVVPDTAALWRPSLRSNHIWASTV